MLIRHCRAGEPLLIAPVLPHRGGFLFVSDSDTGHVTRQPRRKYIFLHVRQLCKSSLLLEQYGHQPSKTSKQFLFYYSWKPVENLVNSGFSDLVANAVNCGYYDPEYGPKVELEKILDTSKRKPHEILYMSKADFRTICQWKNKPSRRRFELWEKYRNIPGKLGAADFFDYLPHELILHYFVEA